MTVILPQTTIHGRVNSVGGKPVERLGRKTSGLSASMAYGSGVANGLQTPLHCTSLRLVLLPSRAPSHESDVDGLDPSGGKGSDAPAFLCSLRKAGFFGRIAS